MASQHHTGNVREVLREPHFARLFVTRLLSQTADGVFQVALASFVLFNPEKQATAGKVALTFATLLLPYSLVGPFAGVTLDRWRRQRVLVVANFIRAAMVVGVAAMVASGISGAPFYLGALAVLSVNRFYLSALSAGLPHVVRTELLVLGNSISTTSGTVVAVIGGSLGYAVRTVAGGGNVANASVMLTATAIYLAAALSANRMAPDLLGPDYDPDRPETVAELAKVVRGIADGGRHLWSHRRAGRAMAAIAAHRFFYGVSTVSTVLLYRNYFHASHSTGAGLGGLGLVFGASAIGYLVAAAITPAATRHFGEERWVCLLYAGAAVVEVVFGVPYQQWSILIAAFFLGIVAQGAKICVDTLVQRSVDDAYRGRVFSFYDIVFNVGFVGAAAFGAALLPTNGKSYVVLTIIAAGYALTAVGYAAISRSVPRPVATGAELAPSQPLP